MTDIRQFSDQYLSYLTNELAGLNLTKITTPEDFYNKQIIDSLTPLDQSHHFRQSLKRAKLLVDIGFGGGFPILPLAYKNPEMEFIGFEARAKKAKAVSQLAEHLNLNNTKLLHQRFEDVLFDRNAVVTFKAVGDVKDLLSKFSTNRKLTVFFYKGPNFYDLEDLGPIKKNWKIVEEISLKVPDTQGRFLIGFQNKKDVLRRTSIKLSEIS